MKALIVHISDIHLREGHKNPSIPKFSFIAPALQNEELEIDKVIVVVSGDVAYGGTVTECKLARNCLDILGSDLQMRLKISDVRFVFVPGNHDCDFSDNDSVRDLT